jgi:ferredoxin
MNLLAIQRFPKPEFEGGYAQPPTSMPMPRAEMLAMMDVFVLLLALSVISWVVLKKRSRKGVFWISLFSLAYFGFYREGCVCSIGAIQNVTLAMFDLGYAIPFTVVTFFIIPLVFTLFFGRTFCAGVCPFGAMQDLIALAPQKLGSRLNAVLGLIPYFYLGLAVLYAATGTDFIICRYDPFVGIFRFNASFGMFLFTGTLLISGIFIARPYCRFLCPYGALLKLAATVAKWRVRVTPDYCTQCRLCEASCPFGAMREPAEIKPEPGTLSADRKRLALLIALIPLLMAGTGWLGWKFSPYASKLHPKVSLAERFVLERDLPLKTGPLSPADLSLDRARQAPKELLLDAAAIRHKFGLGGWIFGAWVGLVVGVKLASLSIHRRRTDYEPDRGECVACARCFEFCPNELVRRGLTPPIPVAPPVKTDPEKELVAT